MIALRSMAWAMARRTRTSSSGFLSVRSSKVMSCTPSRDHAQLGLTLELRDGLHGRLRDDVGLAAADHGQTSVGLGHDLVDDALHLGRRPPPVRIALEHQLLAGRP